VRVGEMRETSSCGKVFDNTNISKIGGVKSCVFVENGAKKTAISQTSTFHFRLEI
jgi:hypothetical protein